MIPLRRATVADLPVLLALDAACFTKPWTAAHWAPELAGAGGVVWILGEPAIGFACAPVLFDTCELRRIAVVADARGRGHGRDLLSAVIAHARQTGCARTELEVAADNHAALALYRSLGFVEVGRRPGYYVEPPADALLLTLES